MMWQNPRLARRSVVDTDDGLTIDHPGSECPANPPLDALIQALDRAILRQSGRDPQEGSH